MDNYQQNHICCSLEHLNNIYIYLSSIGFDKCEPLKNYYAREIIYDGVKYYFFAYEFTDVASAKKYFFEFTAKARFSNNETKDFKIVSTNNKTELTVWKENMAFRLIGKDIEHFNTFRHYIGTIFNSTVYDQ